MTDNGDYMMGQPRLKNHLRVTEDVRRYRRITQLERVQKEAMELFKVKNTDYGDAFANYGPVGVIVRLGDKINRCQQITKNGVTMVKNEKLRDTLIDLHNYAAMAVMLIDEGDEDEGKRQEETEYSQSLYDSISRYEKKPAEVNEINRVIEEDDTILHPMPIRSHNKPLRHRRLNKIKSESSLNIMNNIQDTFNFKNFKLFRSSNDITNVGEDEKFFPRINDASD